MKRVVLFIFLYISLRCVCSADNSLSKYLGDYPALERTNLEGLVKILKDDTIAFVDMNAFTARGNLDMFYYATPDTIWVKKRPKNNPKEGKHYYVRRHYKAAKDGKGVPQEITRVDSLSGKEFVVVGIQEGPGTNVHDVVLRETVSGERVLWRVPSKTLLTESKTLPFNVSLVGKARSLPFVGENVYELFYEPGGVRRRVSGANEYFCNDAQLKLVTGLSLRFAMLLTVTDKNGETTVKSVPMQSYDSFETSWSDVNEYAKSLERTKTYNIDYVVGLLDFLDGSPFEFESIEGRTAKQVYPIQTLEAPKTSEFGMPIMPEPLTPEEAFKLMWNSPKLLEGTQLQIADIEHVRGIDYYKCVINGYAFYLPVIDVVVDASENEKLEKLCSADSSTRNEFFKYTKSRTNREWILDEEEVWNEIENKYGSKGLAVAHIDIRDFEPTTDLNVSLYVTSKDVVKTATMTVQGYNSKGTKVGNPVKLTFQSEMKPDQLVSFLFVHLWDTTDVKSVKVLSMTYTTETGKVVNIPDGAKAVWPDDLYSLTETMSNLNKLKIEIK